MATRQYMKQFEASQKLRFVECEKQDVLDRWCADRTKALSGRIEDLEQLQQIVSEMNDEELDELVSVQQLGPISTKLSRILSEQTESAKNIKQRIDTVQRENEQQQQLCTTTGDSV